MIVDKSLNYGRHIIQEYLYRSLPFNNILDIGAGHGNDLTIGRELNKDAKLYALEYYDSNISELIPQNIDVFKMNIEKDKFPFDNESIDIIIANQILEHVKEIFWIFHEITRVAALGAKLIIGLPNLASLHNRFLLLLGRQPTAIQPFSAHIRGFTYPGLNNFLKLCWQGGYDLIGFRGSNFYPFPPILAKPLAYLYPSFAWGIFLLFKKTRSYQGEFLQYPVDNLLETNFFLGDA